MQQTILPSDKHGDHAATLYRSAQRSRVHSVVTQHKQPAAAGEKSAIAKLGQLIQLICQSQLRAPWEPHASEHVSLCHQPCPRSGGCPLLTLMPRTRCQDRRQDSWCKGQHVVFGKPMCMTWQCRSATAILPQASAVIAEQHLCYHLTARMQLRFGEVR